jgi:hypothetical protein
MRARGWQTAFGGLVKSHRAFTVLVVVGTILRVFAMAGYRPALLYNDTFEYVDVALRLRPFPERPDGYSFFLRALEPAHSFMLVVALQHLLGLVSSALVYALARRRFGLPAWAGCLAAAPLLIDAYWIELEQILLSDALFTALVVVASALAMRRARPSAAVCVGIGALLAAATLTRPAALPAVVGIAIYLVIRRVGWRALGVFVLALGLPLVGYASWYSASQGRFALDDSTGIQLYGRVGGFANCAHMKVRSSSDLSALCPAKPGNGLPAPAWLWYNESPLRQMGGPMFTPAKDRLAMRFAERAILHQPAAYLEAVGTDLWHAIGWDRGPYPNAFSSIRAWTFATRTPEAWPLPHGGFEERAMTRYEHGSAATTVHAPFAEFLHDYQDVFAVRGPFLLAMTALALGGLAVRRRPRMPTSDDADRTEPPPPWGRRRPASGDDRLAPSLITFIGLDLVLMPIFTVQLDYRYLMPAYPFLSLAAASGTARIASRWSHAKDRRMPVPAPVPAPAGIDAMPAPRR